MRIDWSVVVDDGTRPYGSDIAIDQRRPLWMVIGDDTEISVSLVNPVGGVILLTAGQFLQLNLVTRAAPVRPILTVRSTSTAGMRQRLAIAASATQHLSPQSGAFDLWAVLSETDRRCLIPMSEVRLTASALGRNYL